MIIKYFKESKGSIWKYVEGSKDYEISRAYRECRIVSCDEGGVCCVHKALHYRECPVSALQKDDAYRMLLGS